MAGVQAVCTTTHGENALSSTHTHIQTPTHTHRHTHAHTHTHIKTSDVCVVSAEARKTGVIVRSGVVNN